MEYILVAIISYCLGSFPSAYLFVKIFRKIDITQNGSGNVGALNSIRITKSKIIGAAVFLTDAGKGILSVVIAQQIFDAEMLLSATAVFFAVLGHCFSIWIKFKGGRGLATAAGGCALFSLPILVIWTLMWIIAMIFRRNHNFAGFAATILTIALSFSLGDILNKYSALPAEFSLQFSFTATAVLLIILTKHIQPFQKWLATKKDLKV